MNKKELLIELRKIFKNQKDENINNNQKINISKYDINLKIKSFFTWIRENNLKINEEDLKNFIEKMAVWYEFKYPSYKIHNMFYGNKKDSGLEEIVDSQGYKDLLTILSESEQTDLNSFCDLISWKDLFDKNTFFKTLEQYEKSYIENPIFGVGYKFGNNQRIYFSSKGNILEIEGDRVSDTLDLKCILTPYMNMYAKEIVPVLFDYGYFEDGLNILDMAKTYENECLFREKLLDIVMYRIIARGGILGVERGFLFAKEFKRDIKIPMMYLTYNLMNKRPFINEYIKSGGTLDLTCCLYYFSNKIENIEMKLEDVYHQTDKYITEEEIDLRKRIVEIVSLKKQKEETFQKKLKKLEDKWNKDKQKLF